MKKLLILVAVIALGLMGSAGACTSDQFLGTDGVCYQKCHVDAFCPTNWKCNTSTGRCEPDTGGSGYGGYAI